MQNNMDIISVLSKMESQEILIPYTGQLIKIFSNIKTEVNEFVDYIKEDRNRILDIIDPGDESNSDFRNVISYTIDEIGLMEDEPIQEFFKELYSLMVETISFPHNIKEQDHVRIMSLHASKGLSAKFVVITSCIDELLPRINTKSSDAEKRIQLEEQRRLFYVAITRCKCTPDYSGTLVISSFVGLPGKEALQINIPAKPASWRKVRASRFISEFEDTSPETILYNT